jgi:hypothetical protein
LLLLQAGRTSVAASFLSDDQSAASPAAAAAAASSPAAALAGELWPGQVSSGAGPALLNAASISASDLGVRNVHALRILFNCAFRLADSLGPSWALVVEVLCTLDRLLPAAGAGGAKVQTVMQLGGSSADMLCHPAPPEQFLSVMLYALLHIEQPFVHLSCGEQQNLDLPVLCNAVCCGSQCRPLVTCTL